MRILLLEDHDETRQAVESRLRGEGLAVVTARTLEEAGALLRAEPFDVLVLDRTVPDGDARDGLRAWRSTGIATPALFLTARDTVRDRVDGLDAGGDDYLTKPFAMAELFARVRALGRRGPLPQQPIVRIGEVEIDLGRREVRRAGVLLPLRPKERSVLELLASRQGRVVSREELVRHCWDAAETLASNVEEATIASLRRKLGVPGLVRTVRGVGYVLEDPCR
ncbi:response regulator transcription factor [Pendulispora brunnea]|uniref:Response regulator transcription factor n=1 Tax=Pendulispora brunnea TaxID=2905690 RepID=A0ABZ2KBR0_9BACT